MIALLMIYLCSSIVLSDWADDYNNDSRPICPTDFDKKPLSDRIVGGKEAGLGAFPFAVGILMGSSRNNEFRTDNSFCGGTLITELHVLTAAHCLYKNQYVKDYLWLNVNDYDTKVPNEVTNYMRKIKRIEIHPEYVDKTFNNDIAIITLQNSIPYNEDVRMAILPPLGKELDVGTMCTVWGWGRTSYLGSRSTVMLKVDLPITNREECQKHLTHTITENMICAGGKEGEDACLGDSGGSLLSQDGNIYCIAGIVSFGKSCALKDVSGVYTNVARYIDWIYEATRNAACKPRILQRKNYNNVH